MRSRNDMRFVAIAAMLTAALSGGTAAAQSGQRQGEAVSFTPAEIADALATVKNDPNLAAERTIRTLSWKRSSPAKLSGMPAWLTWMAGLARWLEQSTRLLVWGAVVALVVLLVVYIGRTMRRHEVLRRDEPFVAPTHVRDLDIRPDRLPEDIGAAAHQLWDGGDHRAALALLYRGMLSKLAYIDRIPIRDSSTEGDCLALSASHLSPGRHEYTSRLVLVWQRFVYGGQHAEPAIVYGLCDDFGSVLASTPPIDAIGPGGAA